jgi:hypothetical protein
MVLCIKNRDQKLMKLITDTDFRVEFMTGDRPPSELVIHGVCWESIYFESRGSNFSSHIYQYGFARGYARVSSNGKYRCNTGGNTGGMEIPVEWKYRWN